MNHNMLKKNSRIIVCYYILIEQLQANMFVSYKWSWFRSSSVFSVNEKTTSYKLDELKDALKKFKAEKIESESAEVSWFKYDRVFKFMTMCVI